MPTKIKPAPYPNMDGRGTPNRNIGKPIDEMKQHQGNDQWDRPRPPPPKEGA